MEKENEYNITNEAKPGKCDVRLSAKENMMLNELASNNDVTRSDIVRQAIRFFHRWCMEK